jgi:PAS domain S-box-containing protein
VSGWIVAACLLACLGLGLAGWLLRVRRELGASREEFSLLSQQAPMGILRADAEGKCVYANENWCEISGLSLEQTIGHRWSQAVHPDDLARVMTAWSESVAARRPYVEQLRIRPPDGTIRHVLAGARPIYDDRGQISGFIGTVLDITGLEVANRELARRERLLRTLIDTQESEKLLMCHEFHDGLVQYAVGSKMLLEALREGDLSESSRTVVDSVIKCLAKGIEDGRRVIRGIRPAALDDLGLQAALEELADELRESGIAVDATVDPKIDQIPLTLQTTVYRIVQESLNNARKHASSDRMRLTVARHADRVAMSAEDFGCGFDPTTASEGFGLLGIRERARLAGGECTVDSAPGRGTRVRVWLPLPAEQAVGLDA